MPKVVGYQTKVHSNKSFENGHSCYQAVKLNQVLCNHKQQKEKQRRLKHPFTQLEFMFRLNVIFTYWMFI